jgi:excisionase family DNA binding protein
MVKTMSVTQLAEKLGISRTAVLKKIKLGKLPEGYTAEKVGNTWIIIEGEKK